MKTVDYMGHQFSVPNWATYIGADADGNVFVFDYVPKRTKPTGLWFQETNRNLSRCQYVGDLNFFPVQEIK